MCHESYGFLPCTTNVPGNLFLVLTYGFLVYKGATYLSEGSELLLGIMGPGLVGGLLLPILGALPEALIVLASGLSGSRDTAQHQVLTGMGLLAGSTVFLLTLIWGTFVVVGKCDLGPNRVAVDLQNTRGFSLTGTGVSTDLKTTYLARIMAISVVPFVIAGFPNMMKIHHGQRVAVLLALILSFLLVLSYCLYQVFFPWIQRRRLYYVRHKLMIAGILRHAQMLAGDPHLLAGSSPSPPSSATRTSTPDRPRRRPPAPPFLPLTTRIVSVTDHPHLLAGHLEPSRWP
ncbi:unnamed protein product [Urochloa humidicola]